jgi:type I pantothenate kinase
LIGITGSVSVGKSTISNIIKKLAINPPTNLSAQVISTDNFLFPNSQLQKDQILHRKGFPESFDHAAIIEFLSEISEGKPNSIIPIYSHETYDIDGTSRYEVTDLIIIEGVNILQNPIEKNDRGPSIREFLDFSIFIDADESEIAQWYEGRFLKYCSLAEDNTKSFFSQFKNLNMEERKKLASEIWKSVNKPNLDSYIYPSKKYADLIIKKGNDHLVSSLQVPLSWLTSPK